MFDPYLTVLSSPAAGSAVYEGAMQRVTSRDERPPAPLLHCAGTRGDEFLGFTAFASREEMMAMYTSFTAPEVVNEMVARRMSLDVGRDEYELSAMYISDIVPQAEFGIKSPGSIAVATRTEPFESFGDYLADAQRSGSLEGRPHGLLAQLAYSTPEGFEVIDAWESRALGERWHDDPAQASADWSWLDLKSFVVCTAPGADRRFKRSGVGSLPD